MQAKTELWLIRHGETEWSASGKHTSRTDIPLTDNGRRLALHLHDALKDTSFAAVLRSPMGRAKETCEIAGFGNVAQVDDDLSEWDYGVYEGKTTPEIQQQIPGWSVWKDPILGGETVDAVGIRADRVIARALAAADSSHSPANSSPESCEPGAKRVALFAHAHILRILTARWIGLDPRAGALFALSTGSVSILGWERDTRVLCRWNRTFD